MEPLKRKSSNQIIDRIHDLATLPTIVGKIVSKMNDPVTAIRDIENIIENDQVLTSKVLKMVNSSFYGFSRKITRVSDAIVLLGFNSVRSLVVTSSIFDFNQAGLQGVRETIESLWMHSIRCGVIGKLISQRLRVSDANEVFVAGILHDIGKVVICQHLKQEFREIASLIKSEKLPFVDAEESILGTTHCEIGMRLAQKCNLPDSLTEAIAYHHAPQSALTACDIVSLVHVADVLSNSSDLAQCLDLLAEHADKYSLEKLGLAGDSANNLVSELKGDLEEIERYSAEFIF